MSFKSRFPRCRQVPDGLAIAGLAEKLWMLWTYFLQLGALAYSI